MIGSTLSHYTIAAKLGEGGMGVVYRAEDLTLKRQVALKLLPPETASDPDRLERFRREAEIVAALNHPNVVSIHSIEEADGLHFLTMELVEGEGLDAALRRGRMPLARVLRISEAIAAALAAAHERGVVHRDIKPANVMLTPDDHVKVLDFGLGKLSADSASAGEAATQLLTEAAITEAGTVLGTVSYMSPEQARGKATDHRSDIFSLGCVIYEAASSRLPFRGESSIETLHQIIHDEPAPLEELVPDAPPQLQWILRKALAKKPAERYQSARELAVDLKSLRRDLDSGASKSSAASLPGSAEPPQNRATAGKVVVWVLVAAAAVLGLWWFMGRDHAEPEPTVPTAATISLRPITSSGKVTTAAISPDGNYVVHVESDQGRQSLHLRSLQGAQSVQLIPPRPVGIWGMSFTPDGSAIVYGEKSRDHPTGAFLSISTLGGATKHLVSGIDSSPTFSPDGSRMAWVLAQHPTPTESSLMVAHADGTNARALVTVREPELLAPIFHTGPSWSPDGALIAATVLQFEGKARVLAYDSTSGEPHWRSADEWKWAAMVEWLPDGHGLLAIAASSAGSASDSPRLAGHQIWYVPYPDGAAIRLTNDLLAYRVLSLSANGESLVTVQATERSSIAVMAHDGSTPPRTISTTHLDGRFGLDFTPAGRIVHQTVEGGRLQVAVMDQDGSGRRTLANLDEDQISPVVTPEGNIVYLTASRKAAELRMLDLEGRNNRTLAVLGSIGMVSGSGPRHLSLSPDGEWVVYKGPVGGSPVLWRRPLAGGPPEQLTQPVYKATHGTISPDGTRIAYYYQDPGTGAGRIGVMPFTPGEPELRLAASKTNTGSLLRWTRDGEALLVNTMPGDRANIWRVPLDGGEPERLTDFDDQLLFWFGYSPDGETLALARGELIRDAVLIQGFR